MCNVKPEDIVSINYKVYDNKSNCDIKTILDIYNHSLYRGTILYIKNFVVDSFYRGRRFGAKELYKVLEKNNDKLVIIDLEYFPLELHETVTKKQKRKSLINLGKYFLSIGFCDINRYFGKHCDKISMCFKNEAYKNWIKK